MSQPLSGKQIVLGVSGSIAAFKAADIIGRLREQGADVWPVMTQSATKFITPLTLATFARNPVALDLWQEGEGWQPGHIELADRANLLLVAPATANILAAFAHGSAPDFLTSLYLANTAPVLIAPAMNGKMFAHPATVGNIETLRSRGHQFVGPSEGMQACGYSGLGRLAPVEEIVAKAVGILS